MNLSINIKTEKFNDKTLYDWIKESIVEKSNFHLTSNCSQCGVCEFSINEYAIQWGNDFIAHTVCQYCGCGKIFSVSKIVKGFDYKNLEDKK